MCLIAVAVNTRTDLPLVVAANRDEFHARASAPAEWWQDAPAVCAGRDLVAGGTWLGVTRGGRFAALTNYRDGSGESGPRSRGAIVADFLRAGTPADDAAEAFASAGSDFAGFTALLFDGDALCVTSNREDVPRRVAPGLHALSNGRFDSDWPKVHRARDALARTLGIATERGVSRSHGVALDRGASQSPGGVLRHQHASPPPDASAGASAGSTHGHREPAPIDVDALLDAFDDRRMADDATLPDTGVGIERERLLSPMFINTPGENHYGTRCTTVVVVSAEAVWLAERSYDPRGCASGEQRHSHRRSPRRPG